MERLQKLLASAGVGSRRAAERLIAQGHVTVNGRVVTRLGTRVDPARDAVKVDGRRVHAPAGARTYLMLHKPAGYVTTLSDPQGRPTVVDLLGDLRARVFPIGRLDFNSEGLLLLTDDGGLARDLMHPRSGVPRTYRVKVRGRPSGSFAHMACRRRSASRGNDGTISRAEGRGFSMCDMTTSTGDLPVKGRMPVSRTKSVMPSE